MNRAGRVQIRGLYSTHFAAGLLTASAALTTCGAFGFEEHYGILPLALIGLTHGIAARSLQACVLGLVLSATLAMAGAWAGWGIASSHPGLPWPGLEWNWLGHSLALLGSLLGAIVPLRRDPPIGAGFAGAILTPPCLIALGVILRAAFPPQLCILELWEFILILASIPVIACVTWLPVDVSLRGSRMRRDCVERS